MVVKRRGQRKCIIENDFINRGKNGFNLHQKENITKTIILKFC